MTHSERGVKKFLQFFQAYMFCYIFNKNLPIFQCIGIYINNHNFLFISVFKDFEFVSLRMMDHEFH